MEPPRIMKVEAQYGTGIILYLSDDSVIEIVPVQRSGDFPDPDVRQAVLVALRDLLRRAGSGGGT